MRTLILSDLHLGSRSTRAPAHLAALERLCREFDRVILNGDTLDRFEAPGVCAENDRLASQARAALCSRTGPAEFLRGNHDPALSERNWIYLESSQTLVFHGDCIQDMTHPSRKQDKLLAAYLARAWKSRGGRPTEFLKLVDIYRDLQNEFLIANPQIYDRHSKAFYLLRALIPPHRPLQIFSYWHRAPGMVARLAKSFDRPVKTAVVGHSHRGGDWTLDGVRVLNTGSFMPLSKPMAVIADGAHVSIHALQPLLRERTFVSAPSQRLT